MTAQHFDVLIIGAGLSGIGTACQVTAEFPDKTIAVLERRARLGGTWDLFRYPGIRSDSDMLTFGYKFRPWRELKVLADGASIRQYIADTAAEYGIDEKIHYGLKIVGADWSSAESRWTRHRRARGDRRDPPLHVRLPDQLHRLLQLRRRLSADLPGRGAVHGAQRPPPALAGRPGLPRQEGRRDRQRRNGGHAGAGDGRRRRARHDAATLAVVRVLVARVRQDLRGAGSLPAADVGVRVGAQAQHRDPAPAVQGVPSLAEADAPVPAVAGTPPGRARRST